MRLLFGCQAFLGSVSARALRFEFLLQVGQRLVELIDSTLYLGDGLLHLRRDLKGHAIDSDLGFHVIDS
ncbi:hypothetical protein AMJ85_07455 [candidate division BRC1 bacterium SM23_51]|nr:MAG: hypothetical protein AMJ85_07455 [candidate division BRC1 bacterium SM23_51]